MTGRIARVSALVDGIGQSAIVAETGWTPQRVSNWKTRGLPDSRNVDRVLRRMAADAGLAVDWDAVYADKPEEAA
jgi:hypothetical protein